VVLELYIKFGSNIRDQHIYAPDFHLMTSRVLTSVVISVWPWCIFPYNLMHDIFIQSGVIDIFPKFKMAAAAIWICLGEPWSHEASFVVRTSCKNFVMIG